MDLLIAGGGTGGHLFPGIALAQEMRRRNPDARILFVGTKRGIEVRAVPKAGFALACLPVAGLRGVGLLAFILTMMRLPLALLRAFLLVWRHRPQVAVSCGGYAAGPAILAAYLCGVPCFVLEQNAIAGVTNRILGRFARRVIASFPVKGFAKDNVVVLGNPVRDELLGVREIPYRPQQPLRVLAFGGSQGAVVINNTLIEVIKQLRAKGSQVTLVHQTGPRDYERVVSEYSKSGVSGVIKTPFIDDMASAYRQADLVICRAGATTLAELTICGRPAILIPFPFAAGDHQRINAETLAQAGAAICLPQTSLGTEKLCEMVLALEKSSETLVEMAASARNLGRPNALGDIADAIEEEANCV